MFDSLRSAGFKTKGRVYAYKKSCCGDFCGDSAKNYYGMIFSDDTVDVQMCIKKNATVVLFYVNVKKPCRAYMNDNVAWMKANGFTHHDNWTDDQLNNESLWCFLQVNDLSGFFTVFDITLTTMKEE
ncbi:MAG: hypothetical protein HY064_07320 [Bacteroidetes bacterium]|nr:hypothetical protein [Bacteroidota bacterium]